MALVDDLKAAKALIDTPEKWVKGALDDGHNCYCALGAAFKSVGMLPDAPAGTDIEVALENALPSGWGGIVHYNDAPETTHADVLALFDRAIAAASPTNGDSQ